MANVFKRLHTVMLRQEMCNYLQNEGCLNHIVVIIFQGLFRFHDFNLQVLIIHVCTAITVITSSVNVADIITFYVISFSETNIFLVQHHFWLGVSKSIWSIPQFASNLFK